MLPQPVEGTLSGLLDALATVLQGQSTVATVGPTGRSGGGSGRLA